MNPGLLAARATVPIAPGPLTGGRFPMTYLVTHGTRADPATALLWGMIALSLAVVVIISAAVLSGVWVRSIRKPVGGSGAIPVDRPGGGMTWMYVGMPLTVLALAILLVWTLKVMAAIDSPSRVPALTLDITGHEWWWEVRYRGSNPADTFITANEIHIPTGVPILVKLTSGDVIHAFWIPGLTGKTQTIPGRTNVSWIEADRPGVYRGQCAQFCGLQHAHMALYAIAETPAAYAAWRQNQLQPAILPTQPGALAGQDVFVAHCGACHTVAGTSAGGIRGPDLTHLMSRGTLAAGALDNTPNGLSGWIADPQSIKPGAKMPATLLSGPQLRAVVAYLETLK
jgi:cytochrome c oxidase subunit 2